MKKEQNFRKWNKFEKVKWGIADVTFFEKTNNILIGQLSVPGKQNTLIDKGHKNGEYLNSKKGNFSIILYHENGVKEYIEVHEGDWVFIPKNVDHQTINSSDQEIIANFIVSL